MEYDASIRAEDLDEKILLTQKGLSEVIAMSLTALGWVGVRTSKILMRPSFVMN